MNLATEKSKAAFPDNRYLISRSKGRAVMPEHQSWVGQLSCPKHFSISARS